MKALPGLRVILGPCPCSDCGRPLVYCHTRTSYVELMAPTWRNPNGLRHICRGARAA